MRNTRETIPGFIVFEGIDGSGTTTQLGLLKTRLHKTRLAFSIGFEPTLGPIGALVRQALSGAFDARAETVARLFVADRGEHLYASGGIVERCARGELVISDRYLFSSLVYQGLTCGPSLPERLNEPFPLPELVIFFELHPAIAAQRMCTRSSLEIYENIEFQGRVAERYRTVLASFEDSGMKVERIDAGATSLEVEEAVWHTIAPIAERLSRR